MEQEWGSDNTSLSYVNKNHNKTFLCVLCVRDGMKNGKKTHFNIEAKLALMIRGDAY